MSDAGKRASQVVWFTGLSGAGKSTLSCVLEQELSQLGLEVEMLDGDELRRGLCSDLGFSLHHRLENVRRIAYAAQLLARNGRVVLVAVISPYQQGRDMARLILPTMIEVFVDAPLALCEERDPKQLYERARSGLIKNFTGIDSPYEVPISPDLTCRTDRESIMESVSKVRDLVVGRLRAAAA